MRINNDTDDRDYNKKYLFAVYYRLALDNSWISTNAAMLITNELTVVTVSIAHNYTHLVGSRRSLNALDLPFSVSDLPFPYHVHAICYHLSEWLFGHNNSTSHNKHHSLFTLLFVWYSAIYDYFYKVFRFCRADSLLNISSHVNVYFSNAYTHNRLETCGRCRSTCDSW